jgi:hypothetical protein
MIFDTAKEIKWVTSQRVDHIGFGVVQGDDGKRFKTRSLSHGQVAPLWLFERLANSLYAQGRLEGSLERPFKQINLIL